MFNVEVAQTEFPLIMAPKTGPKYFEFHESHTSKIPESQFESMSLWWSVPKKLIVQAPSRVCSYLLWNGNFFRYQLVEFG